MSAGGSLDRGELCARREDVHHVKGVPDKSNLRRGTTVPLQQRYGRGCRMQVPNGLADELRLHKAVRQPP